MGTATPSAPAIGALVGSSMKQVLQNRRSGELRVAAVPVPMVRAGHVLVRNAFSIISSGTERTTVAVSRQNLLGKARSRPDLVRKVVDQARSRGVLDTYRLVRQRLDEDVALGYSSAGLVMELGAGADGFAVGQRVACAGQNYASHAEWVCVPKHLCVPVPDSVPLDQAAYVALGAVALQGLRQAEPQLAEVVALVGLGLVGQVALRLLLASGCVVVAADPDLARCERALKAGAHRAVPPELLADAVAAETGGRGVDVVLIAASTADSGPVRTAGAIARQRGRVVVLGDVGLDIPRDTYYAKELELRLSTSYGPGRYDPSYEQDGVDYPYGYVRWTEHRNMSAFLRLLAERRIEVADLTTHRYPVDRAVEAYELLMQSTEPAMGILLDYGSPEPAPVERLVSAIRPSRRREGVRLGIIGAGGHLRDTLLPSLQRIPAVSIAGVCSAGGVASTAVRDRVGARYAATDPDLLFADPEIDAVLIATRHDSHADLIVRALAADKHVFVEKPLCLTRDELERIRAAYHAALARSGLVLATGFNRRYSVHARRLAEFFAARRNPLVMSFRVNAGALPLNHWTLDPAVGGGRIIGEGCHFVDFMQFLAGGLPDCVDAVRVGRHDSGCTDDKALVQIRFTDGSIGSLLYTGDGDRSLGKERLEVFADGKAAVLDDFRRLEMYEGGRVRAFRTRVQDKGFQACLERFVVDVAQGRPDPERFESVARTTLATFVAVERLAAPREPVR